MSATHFIRAFYREMFCKSILILERRMSRHIQIVLLCLLWVKRNYYVLTFPTWKSLYLLKSRLVWELLQLCAPFQFISHEYTSYKSIWYCCNFCNSMQALWERVIYTKTADVSSIRRRRKRESEITNLQTNSPHVSCNNLLCATRRASRRWCKNTGDRK